MGYNIAIDGPAGAGKSTVAKLVAKKLGFVYVDTGALYRALAVFFLDRGLSPDDKAGVSWALRDAHVTINYTDGIQQVYVNGDNVSDRLRSEEVGEMASVCSAIPEVRAHLLNLQRELADKMDVVMDGRDIGTHILPNADMKIFLTADTATRAKRRYLELCGKGIKCDLDTVMKDIAIRDERDSSRKIAPLRKADDAVCIDTSGMGIGEVTDDICSLFHSKR